MNKSAADKTKQLERRIISSIVKECLRRGLKVSVWDGEAFPVGRSTKYRKIMDAIMSTDMDELVVRDPVSDKQVCWFQFIYDNGNDGKDVMSDCSDNELAKELTAPMNALLERLG